MIVTASAPVRVVASRHCVSCRHFENTPESLEKAIPGLRVMGSAYSSVRSEDGLCAVHLRYISAAGHCVQYENR